MERHVQFADPALEEAVVNRLCKPVEKVTRNDLGAIRGIIIAGSENSTPRGLRIPWYSDGDAMDMVVPDLAIYDGESNNEKLASDMVNYFSHIRSLHIVFPASLKKLSFIKEVKSLKEFYISGCEIEDWGFLESLLNLKMLSVRESNFYDLSPLGDLSKRQREAFDSEGEKISRLFSGSLTNLEISGCGVSDITPLADGEFLRDLNLSHNSIVEILPLGNLRYLFNLSIRWNRIEDIAPIRDLRRLYQLNLRHNRIKDISVLEDFSNSNLSRLFLNHNNILDYSPVKHLNLIESDIPAEWS